ncbi:MAG TPA: entericidin A/B family lipoprotein [Ramlibacter sp.]|jgi:predicted small secreted protein|nr:entericidin A/B family lipoprotein [Ramlibacter sp.]HZY20359.1 entericidin A/B family lipoprotein [Ramlibacter sp.]
MTPKKIAALLALAALLAGCNTVKGFGQDLQKAGDKIEDAANRKR